MKRKLKVLIVISRFWEHFIKYQTFYEAIQAIEEVAEVKYWHQSGEIQSIIKTLNFIPDFIFLYDFSGNLAPHISGLEQISIPKGCLVIDSHFSPPVRKKYMEENKIDLVFSITKYPFLQDYPEYENNFRWLPWSINPLRFKDWQMGKNIKFLLMGLLHCPVQNQPYRFRAAVLDQMKNVEGFVHHSPMGHFHGWSALNDHNIYVLDKFAQEINKAEIFFTCGGYPKFPVLKFFEAPACRTLLLAEPNPDILELGFKDGINFVACNEDDLYEKAIFYSNHEQERKRITDNGYEFIHNHHTNQVRARQFVRQIETFLKS